MGSLPFYDTDITQTLTNTINGDYKFGDRVIISSKAQDLIEQLLKNDPKERISLDRALEHEWFHILS
jgi:serine/threonine protein kinase